MKLRKDKWEHVTIGDIALIQYGSSQKMEMGEEGFKTFRMNEIVNGLAFDNGEMKKTLLSKEDFEAYRLQKGDILFNRTNSYELVGRTGIFDLDGEYMFASYLLRLKINPQKADSFFVTHLMTSHFFQKQLKTVATKAVGQANINPTNLKKQILPLPPLEDQIQIAALFQSIELAIKNVDGQEKNLLNLKSSLLNKLIEVNNEWGNLFKSDWNKVKFSDVISNLVKTEKNPLLNGLTKAIGLKNIKPNDLTIQSYIDIELSDTKFSRVFRKGQYLFGARRAYLKQMVLANFDGVCTANIMVFDVKNEDIIFRDYIALIIQSDVFIKHATNTSVGSLFPNAKWSAIAAFEFQLPDLKTQKIILELFKGFEAILLQIKQQKTTLKNLKQKLLNEIFE